MLMGLQYKYNEKTYSLEGIIKKLNKKELWDILLKDEYEFWANTNDIDDIIIETSDVFEEVLLTEENIEIQFHQRTNNKFDYDYLLSILED
jgi:hypothetical protein